MRRRGGSDDERGGKGVGMRAFKRLYTIAVETRERSRQHELNSVQLSSVASLIVLVDTLQLVSVTRSLILSVNLVPISLYRSRTSSYACHIIRFSLSITPRLFDSRLKPICFTNPSHHRRFYSSHGLSTGPYLLSCSLHRFLF